MDKKTIFTFVGGVIAGSYMMYNKLYREITKIALGNDEKKEEVNNENEEA